MNKQDQKNAEVLKKFEGKTLESVDTSSVNFWTLHFTDGTYFGIEVVAVVPSANLYGMEVSEGE